VYDLVFRGLREREVRYRARRRLNNGDRGDKGVWVVIVTAADMLSRCREGYLRWILKRKENRRTGSTRCRGPRFGWGPPAIRGQTVTRCRFRLNTEISIHRTKSNPSGYHLRRGEKTDIAAKPARRPPPRGLCDSMLLGTIRSLASRLRLIPRKNWLSRPLPSEPAPTWLYTEWPLTRHVTHPSRLDHMSHGSGQCKQDAKSSSSNVRPAEERLLAADPSHCGDDHRLGATKLLDGIV
jgi:hypothetical protein